MIIKKIIKKVINLFRPITIVKANISVLGSNKLLMGRTAFVTGGTSGIGKGIAEAFLNAGASVIITSRSIDNARKTEEELKSKYPESVIYGIAMDNRDINSFRKVIESVLDLDGIEKIDILVNNAGIGNGIWGHTTEEEYDNVMDTNLKGLFFITDLIGHYMVENKIKGNILNICSSSSLRPANSAYCFSKWGLRGFTEGLAKTLIPYDIVVNGIAPGPTATPLMGMNNNDNLYNEHQPNGRYATIEEIANMAVIYVSDMGRTIVGDIAYMTGGCAVFTYDDSNDRYLI